MKIKEWHKPHEQSCRIGQSHWNVARLWELSRGLPVMDVPLDHLYTWHEFKSITLREMVMHMKAVLAADLSMPIILDEDGVIMDGRHRLMKAMLNGEATIRAVRFEDNPTPDKTED